MMSVRRMRWIVDVTAEGGLPGVAWEAARRWRGATLAYVRSSANHVFRVSLPGEETGYLRLAPFAERSRAALEAEIAFVAHVERAGLVVARPLPSVGGAFIEEVQAPRDQPGALDEAQRYFALVFAGLRGRQIEASDLDEPQCRAWGRALAQLHQASRAFPLHPARATWRAEIERARASLPGDERAIAQVLDAGMAWLGTLAGGPEEYGLLHGDFELDNLVWDGARPQVLDFDSAVYAPYALDVAMALDDVWSGDDPRRDDLLAGFYGGYRDVLPLPAGLPEAMPRLLALVMALKMARLLQAYAPASLSVGNDAAGDPPWLASMRARHQRWLDARRAALIWP